MPFKCRKSSPGRFVNMITQPRNYRIGNPLLFSGTNVMANLSYIHLNPNIWKSPETFEPERFLDEFGHFCNQDNLIPFSVGKRVCLGQSMAEQELFLFLTGFLFRFTFQPCPDSTLPNVDFAQDEVNTSFIRYPPYYQVILKPRLLKWKLFSMKDSWGMDFLLK